MAILLGLPHSDMQSDSSPRRILLAEDNDADAMLVEEALRRHGIDSELIRAKDGERAIEFVEAFERDGEMAVPQLFILDLHLPKHDGLEIMQRIRAGLRCRETPIIVLSGSDAPKDREAVQKHSAIYFRKPSDLDCYLQLGAIVREVVSCPVPKGIADVSR
jgi:CheY-like chemotaxis protein